MSGQIICIGLPTGRHTGRNRVHTSRRSSVGSQDSCDRYDDRLEYREFDCSHMTIGMTTGLQTYAKYLAAPWLTVYQWS